MKNIILSISFLGFSSESFSQTSVDCKVSGQLFYSAVYDSAKDSIQVTETQNGTQTNFPGVLFQQANKAAINNSSVLLDLAKAANVDINLVNSLNIFGLSAADADHIVAVYNFIDVNGMSLGSSIAINGKSQACL